jgi:hypothetical protein
MCIFGMRSTCYAHYMDLRLTYRPLSSIPAVVGGSDNVTTPGILLQPLSKLGGYWRSMKIQGGGGCINSHMCLALDFITVTALIRYVLQGEPGLFALLP